MDWPWSRTVTAPAPVVELVAVETVDLSHVDPDPIALEHGGHRDNGTPA